MLIDLARKRSFGRSDLTVQLSKRGYSPDQAPGGARRYRRVVRQVRRAELEWPVNGPRLCGLGPKIGWQSCPCRERLPRPLLARAVSLGPGHLANGLELFVRQVGVAVHPHAVLAGFVSYLDSFAEVVDRPVSVG